MRRPPKDPRNRASRKHEILRLRLIYESFVKMAVNSESVLGQCDWGKPLHLVRHSHPMLSDSSIRRLMRQRNISQRCRNQNASLRGPMRRARLALRGRHRFPIGLSFLKHPEASLGEVARDSDFGFAMAAPGLKASIKPAHMSVVTAPGIEHGTI